MFKMLLKGGIKKGFTLAEVLVTLALLGVLGAILIPAVISTKPNKNKMMFRKAYNSLVQVISKMINDDVNYSGSEEASGTQRGFNYTSPTTNGTVNKFCHLLSDSLNTVGNVTCPNTLTAADLDTSEFNTSDGMTWHLYIPVTDFTNNNLPTVPDDYFTSSAQFPIISTSYTTKVVVDVNGSSLPNCTADTGYASVGLVAADYCADNPDTFIFGIRYDGKIQIGSGGSGTDPEAEDILLNPTDNM